MSILLDALKKSEAQRVLGETPTIHSGMVEEEQGGSNSPAWVPVLLLVSSFLLMAWLGWQQYLAPDDLQTAASAEEAAAGTDGADTELATTQSGTSEAADSLRTPVEGFSDPSASSQPTGAGPEESVSEMEMKRNKLNRSFSQYRSEAGEPVVVSADEPGIQQPTASQQTQQDTTARPPPEQQQLIASEEAPVQQEDSLPLTIEMKEPDGGDSRMEPHISEPISYYQVPQSLRNEMGEFRITVLVYAERVEDRFLLMNGERMEEGEEVSDGPKLEEIRRGSAVFSYRNYRFLVER